MLEFVITHLLNEEGCQSTDVKKELENNNTALNTLKSGSKSVGLITSNYIVVTVTLELTD